MKASYKKYILDFKRPSGTSRGIMTKKETWFLILEKAGRYGIGECGLLKGLSIDDRPEYESKLQWACDNIALGKEALWSALMHYPSIQFGIEQAFISLASNSPYVLFPSSFTDNEAPIPINGLIWMGDEKFMLEQLHQKLQAGFRCIKMKIGAIDFGTEVSLLSSIRQHYSADDIELRVDANGAFSPYEAMEKLHILAKYGLHSIEQPIKPGNLPDMKELCNKTPIPIVLDEELIGIFDATKKEQLLQTTKPHYIILKPSLVGGFHGSEEWIGLAEKYNIGWWITSTLESNIGLNAIAQWTYSLKTKLPQGLGTGSLFTNNFESPLTVQNGNLYYKNDNDWEPDLIKNLCI
ncbi:o-succinylbenzoate synthase [Spongiimicrobium sp. 3-5]|uniref:o-succinylbenzoate synthase n=1 Tax=Spongiimicrobium sp. 3-5 TaxID=3332596 RepID=UPI00397F43F0